MSLFSDTFQSAAHRAAQMSRRLPNQAYTTVRAKHALRANAAAPVLGAAFLFNQYCLTICVANCKTIRYNKSSNGGKNHAFEWDENKEKINISKHGLDFSTAALVFRDQNRLEWFDELHSDYEDRYITIGEINGIAVVLMVVYTERGDAIRLISARKATKQERRMYYGAQGN